MIRDVEPPPSTRTCWLTKVIGYSSAFADPELASRFGCRSRVKRRSGGRRCGNASENKWRHLFAVQLRHTFTALKVSSCRMERTLTVECRPVGILHKPASSGSWATGVRLLRSLLPSKRHPGRRAADEFLIVSTGNCHANAEPLDASLRPTRSILTENGLSPLKTL